MTKFNKYTIWVGSPEAPGFRLDKMVTRETMQSARYCPEMLGIIVNEAIHEFDRGVTNMQDRGVRDERP